MVHDEAPQAPAPAPAAPVAPPAAAPAVPAVAPALAHEPTLHDFVLNLLQDPSAKHAFDLDPHSCLQSAGLADITPADVHDVIPLVTDLVQTNGLPTGLPTGVGDLTSSLNIDGVAGLDGGFATVGGVSPLGAFEGAGAADVRPDGLTLGFRDAHNTQLGDFFAGGGADIGTDAMDAGAIVHSPFGSAATSLNGGFGADGVVFGGSLSAADHTFVLNAEQGIGSLELQQDVVPGLPGNVGDLAKGLADPTAAASALAGAVPALPALPAVPGLPGLPEIPAAGLPSLPNLPVDVPSLPALPSLPTGQVNHGVDTGQAAFDHTVDGTQSGQLPDVLGHLPTGGLPALPGIPHLPQLPVELPHLPVQLPHLPVDVPHLPSLPIGGASGQGPVGDVVDHTGLGGVINNNPVTNVVHDIAPDLHLGL